MREIRQPMLRYLLLFVIGGLLSQTTEALGSAPYRSTIGQMIVEADCVAIVSIVATEPIKPGLQRELVWAPNTAVTVRLQNNIRGELPELFQVNTEVTKWRNRGATRDAIAIVFVSTRKHPGEDQPIFSSGSGFRVASELVPGGSQRANAEVLSSIVATVRSMEPQKGGKARGKVVLAPEALSKLLKCGKSFDVDVRNWLLDAGLRQVELSSAAANDLVIELTTDQDLRVASAAVRLVMDQQLHVSDQALTEFADRLPPNEKHLLELIERYRQRRKQ